MKRYLEILNNVDDGAIALDLFDRGIPGNLYQPEGGAAGIGWLSQNLMRLEGAIAANGFSSIFDQALLPWELDDYEAFLSRIGAGEFLRHFAECRRIYFGGREVPKDNGEWLSFKSIIWTEPDGPESREFDAIADKATEAYYGHDFPERVYMDLHIKLGAYFRKHFKSMVSAEDLAK